MILSASSIQPDHPRVSRKQRLDQSLRRNKIGVALSTILMIGGVWLTLAVYRVFPKSPNLLSNLKKYGKVICFGTLGGGTFLSAALGFKILLDAGADPNAVDENGTTALRIAAIQGHAEGARALVEGGADLNAVNKNGFNALMRAALNGHTEVVRILLDVGTDPNIGRAFGFTALMWAAAGGHAESVRALVEGGADPNIGRALGFEKSSNLRQTPWQQERGFVATSEALWCEFEKSEIHSPP